MNYKDEIIRFVADEACKKISKNIIKDLKRMKEGLQSGDDSGLMTI
jgi:hypothetical protein